MLVCLAFTETMEGQKPADSKSTGQAAEPPSPGAAAELKVPGVRPWSAEETRDPTVNRRTEQSTRLQTVSVDVRFLYVGAVDGVGP